MLCRHSLIYKSERKHTLLCKGIKPFIFKKHTKKTPIVLHHPPINLGSVGRGNVLLDLVVLATARAVVAPVAPGIVPTGIVVVGDRDVVDIVPDLHPPVAGGRDGGESTAEVVDQRGDSEAGKEVESVDVGGAHGDVAADGAGEADHVDEDAGDVGGVGAPVDTPREVVRPRLAGVVQLLDLEVAAADELCECIHGQYKKEQRQQKGGRDW